ncbi:MAG: hypothetical protein ACR2G2_09070 [Pseudonocardia sp.]
MQAKIESSAVGRALISLVVICIMLPVLVVNMPDSEIKTYLLDRGVSVFVRATGLDQNWGVFSDVRRISLYVEGHIDYADGTSSVAAIPHGPGIEAYSDYRWHKYGEQLRLDDNARLWKPYATLLADRARAQGKHPVRVSLVRRFADTLPPGPGPERGPWTEFTFYVLPLDEPG